MSHWKKVPRLTLNTKTAQHEQWELPYTNMIRKQNTWTKMRICAIDDFFIFGTSYYQRHVLQCHSFHFWTYNFWQMCIMIPRLHTGPQKPQDTKPILEGIKVQNGLSMIDRPYPLSCSSSHTDPFHTSNCLSFLLLQCNLIALALYSQIAAGDLIKDSTKRWYLEGVSMPKFGLHEISLARVLIDECLPVWDPRNHDKQSNCQELFLNTPYTRYIFKCISFSQIEVVPWIKCYEDI